MIFISSIKKKIKKIRPSQRSRHDIIISILDDIVELIRERCGDDPKVDNVIEKMKENKDGLS